VIPETYVQLPTGQWVEKASPEQFKRWWGYPPSEGKEFFTLLLPTYKGGYTLRWFVREDHPHENKKRVRCLGDTATMPKGKQ